MTNVYQPVPFSTTVLLKDGKCLIVQVSCVQYIELYIDLYIKYACGVIPSHELDLTGSNGNNFSCVFNAENAKLVLVISSFQVMTDNYRGAFFYLEFIVFRNIIPVKKS